MYIVSLSSGRLTGDSGGSVESYWSPDYFIFMGNSEKMQENWSNRTPSAKLDPLFETPGSSPALLLQKYQ